MTALDRERSHLRRAARRQAILDAATEVFFEVGYEGASIDAIIDRVGGSKRTIYNYFGTKRELFAAIVRTHAAAVVDALPSAPKGSEDLERTLFTLGRTYLGILMSPIAVGIFRLVVAERARFPELAETFFDNGPGRVTARLAAILDRHHAAGAIAVEDSHRAAGHFLGMIRNDQHVRVLLGLCEPPDSEDMDRSVREAVGLFLLGCRPRRTA